MLPENERLTYATTPIATPGDTLIPSGIAGSVWLVRQCQPILSSSSF